MINALDTNSMGEILDLNRFNRAIGKLREQEATSTDLLKLKNDDSGLKTASQEFEAIFINMLLQQFRASASEDGLIPRSNAVKTFEEMMDSQMATNLSRGESFGISDMMFQQLKGAQETYQSKSSEIKGTLLERNG